MSVFDLLFMLAFLASAVTVVIAAVSAVRGRTARSLKMLRLYAAGLAGYLALAVSVSYFKPQRVIAQGVPWCFDDWCLTVTKVERAPDPQGLRYGIDLRVSSQAHRVSQRASGAWIYLIDGEGRRYAPESDATATPLDVLLQPGESFSTSRTFRVPAEAHGLGLVTGHGGPYCGPMDILVIGNGGCLFNKPPQIRIQ